MHSFLENPTLSMVERSPVATIATDVGGVIHGFNPVAGLLLGVDRAKWLGRGLVALLDASGRQGLAQQLEILAEGDWVPEQTLRLTLAGEQLSLSLSNFSVFEGGDCVGVIWSLRETAGARAAPSAETPRQRRYEALFQSAALPQFVMDIRAIYGWVQERKLVNPQVLRQLLQAEPQLLEAIRAHIHVDEVNDAAREMLGCDEASALGARMRALASEAQIQQAALIAIAVFQGKKQLEYAHDFVDSQGRTYKLLAVCALPPADQLEQGVLVSSLDITELTEMQAEMRTRERFLSATLRALPDLLLVYDYAERRPIFMNEAVSRLLGYDWVYIENLGERFIDELAHPEDVLDPNALLGFRARLARGEIVESQLRIRHANGDWKPFQCRSASLESRCGLCRIGVMVARDVTEQLRVREQIDRQERRYKLLAENFSDIVCTVDEHLDVTYISPSVERMLGYRLEHLDDRGLRRLLRNPYFDELRRTLSLDVAKAKRERNHPPMQMLDYLRLFEFDFPHRNHTMVSLEVQCSLMWDEQGALQGLLLVCRDVTQRAQIDADRRLAAKVFENSLEGIFITGRDGKISQINRAFTELTGYDQQNALGQRPSLLASKTAQVSFATMIKPVLDRVGFWQGELWARRKNGTEFNTAVGITSVVGKQGELLGYITSFKDITERKNTEDRIRKLAYFDPLTGLPNRSLFQDRLNQELHRAKRNGNRVALLFLDLDRFKAVNDSMGHAAGDVLLGKIAERLGACVRGNDSLARMGGDEFTIILGDLSERAQALAASASVARKVMEALDEPIVLQGCEVFVSVSIGIAVYPQDGEDANTLLQHADVAMYNAKQAGKNTYQFYIADMNARALEKLELQNGLYRAAVNCDFRVMYQPIVDLRNGLVIGVEALLRWNHPERGPIEPEEFVPVAEESGLIVRIGQWVLHEACQQMACWLSAGHDLHWIAVNISARQFSEGNLEFYVVNALEDSALPASYLELELTESILLDDRGSTLQLLGRLKAEGVELAIDDFGTGYSSLSYLKQFPIDRLKIDRAFVKFLEEDEEDQRITQAIIAIAHSFNLSVVAEGVETQAQEDFLRRHGCEAVQGYFYGHPMTAEDLTQVLLEQLAQVTALPSS